MPSLRNGEVVACPWCLRKVQIDSNGLLARHEHILGECRVSSLTLRMAQEITDAEMVHHIMTRE
jgi:hypothetical protein